MRRGAFLVLVCVCLVAVGCASQRPEILRIATISTSDTRVVWKPHTDLERMLTHLTARLASDFKEYGGPASVPVGSGKVTEFTMGPLKVSAKEDGSIVFKFLGFKIVFTNLLALNPLQREKNTDQQFDQVSPKRVEAASPIVATTADVLSKVFSSKDLFAQQAATTELAATVKK